MNRNEFIIKMESQIKDTVEEKFPVVTDSYSMSVENLTFRRPNLESVKEEAAIKSAGKTLKGSLRGDIIIKDKEGNEVDRKNRMKILDVPYPSHRGTFIAQGNEKVVLHQNVSKNGVYVSSKGNKKASSSIFLKNYNGPRFSIDVDEKRIRVSIGQKNFPGIAFFNYIGLTDSDIRDITGGDSYGRQLRDNLRGGGNATLDDLFELTAKKAGSKATSRDGKIEAIQEYFRNGFELDEDEKETLEDTLSLTGADSYNVDAIKTTAKKIVDVARGTVEEDDRDDLLYQKVKSPTDLISETVGEGLDSFISSVKYTLGPRKREIKLFSNNLAKSSRSLNDFMSTDSRVSDTEEINPLQLATEESTMVSTGKGGLNQNILRHNKNPRNLKRTGINRLDPVHTPESGKIGLSLRLTQDAEAENGTITTKFLKVTRGKAEDNDNNIVKLTPKEEHKSYVAFNSPRDVEKVGGAYVFKNKKTPGRYKGNMIDIPIDKVEYIDRRPQGLFDFATNMIPFGSHNDGNRMLMGANMQTQALDLKNKEEPLVQVDSGDGKTYEEIMGDKSFTVKSPFDGTVTGITDDSITLEDEEGNEQTIEIYDYFPLNRDGVLNNEPVVEIGQKVKEGQLLAEGWMTKNGKLALGLNAKVGYMPYKGYNFEDGIVVSESFAKKMATEEIIKIEVAIKDDQIGGPGSGAKRLLSQFSSSGRSLANLDSDGIIQPGTQVEPGDILVGRLKNLNEDDETVEQSVLRSLTSKSERYKDISYVIPQGSYTKGKVLRVNSKDGGDNASDKFTVVVEVRTEKTLKPGDKLSGRHGNKGTITKILSDDEMPETEDHDKLEVMFSPLAVPSRKNIGQLLEVNSGLVARKTGEKQIVQNFDPESKEKVLKKLEEIGIADGKENLINPETGKPYENKVTVGDMYMMKLKHKVDDKIQARGTSEGRFQTMHMSPEKAIGEAAGEKHNPQRLGEMEMRALQANKAVHNILEATTLKGDGGGDAKNRANIFRVLAGREKPEVLANSSGTPESLKILRDYAMAAGINIRPFKGAKELKDLDENFDSLSVTPHRDSDIVNLIGKDKEVKNGKIYFVSNKNQEKQEKGGLYDPEIFGDAENTRDPDEVKKTRTNWGYIKLDTPVPNPIYTRGANNAYTTLTGLAHGDFEKLVKKGTHVLVTNPGDTGLGLNEVVSAEMADDLEIDGKKFEYKVGGEALEHLLEQIDVNKEITKVKKELKGSKGKERDALYKKYRMLNNLKENKLMAKDLVTRVVPVAPAYLRPRMKEGDNISTDDLTKLYSRVANSNNEAKKVDKNLATAEDKLNVYNDIYRQVEGLVGTAPIEDNRTKEEMQGISQKIKGSDESKKGLIRDKMLSKKVDYSGRSVIGVDPNLKLNQAAIPAEMAKYMYKPFIVKELIASGAARNQEDAEKKLEDLDNPDVIKAMRKATKDRPVMLNRAPSLHKASIQAFEPIIKRHDERGNPVRSIHLNPLVTSGFNADFDGDQMAAHVPLTEKARKEANKLMKPSENLINPRNGEIITEIKHEMIQGIYYLTMKANSPNEGDVNKFNSFKDVRKAYDKGDVRTHAKVSVKGQDTTVGQVIFNSSLPEAHRKWGQLIGKREINEIIKEMYDDDKISKIDLSNTLDKLKEIGFDASTKSGMSIGVKDFVKQHSSKISISDTIKDIDEELDKDPGSFIAKFRDMESSIEDEYKESDILGEDNPVRIMMESKARGNPGQIRRMADTVGIGRDINEKLTMPVLSSHLDGLMPHEYYTHSYDSRKGLSDRALGTAAPGKLTREVWASVQDVLVTEKDCNTREGISKPLNKSLVGRFTAENVSGIIKRDEMITKEAFDKMKTSDVKNIKVRSPITCEAKKGVCQKCYGANPGTLSLPQRGDPVGIVASQSLGEPITQMTMNTFHSGAADSSATIGLPRVEEILNMSKIKDNSAVLAKESGTVIIEPTPDGEHFKVKVGNSTHKIKKSTKLKVKNGDIVNRGDFLTYGSPDDLLNPDIVKDKKSILPSINPMDIVSFNRDKGETKALNMGKEYVSNSLDYAMAKTLNSGIGEQIDSRHLEIIADKLGDKVKITDAGDSDFVEGQEVSKKEVDEWNKKSSNSWFDGKKHDINKSDNIIGARAGANIMGKGGKTIARKGEVISEERYKQMLVAGLNNVKVFPKPVRYESQMLSLQRSYDAGNENWFSNLGSRDSMGTLGRATLFGQKDDLSDPRGRQMAGLLQPIGEGFNQVKDFAGSLGKTIKDMFD